jgi:anthranilate synthase component I
LRIQAPAPTLIADDLPDLLHVPRLGLALQAVREPPRVVRAENSPYCFTEATREGRFFVPMNTTTRTLDTDLLTPLAAYLRLRKAGRASFLLESVEHGRLGRHSFVGCGDRIVSFEEADELDEAVVGYLGYDHIAKLEPTVPLPAEGPDAPESRFVVATVFLRFDHTTGTAEVLVGDADEVALLLAAPAEIAPHPAACHGETLRSPDRDEHLRRIEVAKEHIRRGDIFQVVLSQRAERDTDVSPLEVYRALRRINPSPYLFLLELDGISLVGSSPETHVKAEGRRASLNPIAGTIARGDGDAEYLLSSEKDRAEHVMLVDLGRNDLSRVCVPGTVKVERFLEPERFSHVTHLVSEVAGELREGVSASELLRATFPAGTVSGAPKVRAMQIISELEGYRRGTYAGVVGYSLPGISFDTCIALRTVRFQDGRAYLQAGGGIVADSVPSDEHQECLNKLAAIEAAIETAEGAR